MASAPKVALLIETSNAYAREILRGIENYIRSHGPWSVYLAEHGRGAEPPAWLNHWQGQGIIARIENRRIAKALELLKLPIVDVSAARLLPHLPCVETDDAAIAQAAAEHFLERGYRTFAFCGDRRFNWSKWRGEHFARQIREAGHACYVYEPALTGPTGEEELEALTLWIQKLPKPLAVFACYDARGQQVLDACRRADLAVPEQVAVLGVDNDEVLCNLTPPPLSSIIPNAVGTGWEAAALLDRWMTKGLSAPEARFIPPLGIATRQSSDVVAVSDRHVALAAQLIREQACSGASVTDITSKVPMARRTLEQRFRALLGRSLRQELSRVQINRVKELLTGTELTLAEIADRTGFRHTEYLSVAFKRATGLPPRDYREQHTPTRRPRLLT